MNNSQFSACDLVEVKSTAVSALPPFVIITPARNEAQFIELTIQSMLKQSARPLKWIIVSDGSTDGTDDIIKRCTREHHWVELLRTPERRDRNFAGKVHAFNTGWARVSELSYEVIGNLDADVSFGPEHFRYLVTQFAERPELGVAGAPFREGLLQYDYRFSNVENVWGGCQLFRKQCFEDIGGYAPVPGGCIDHIAVVSARMKGWQTRTFTGTLNIHHRTMGTAENGGLKAKFKYGAKDYSVGNHPLWEVFRALYQMRQHPVVIGGLAIAAGYFWSMARRVKRPVPQEFVTFTRREQLQRLGNKLLGHKTMTPATRMATNKQQNTPSNGDYNMHLINRTLTFARGLLLSYGPTSIKKITWDREFSSGKWNFLDDTAGDPVYSHLNRYAASKSVLDLGCGPGNTANEMAPGYQKYVGVDISEEALVKARCRTEANGRTSYNSFEQGDFLGYVPSQKFDVILFREAIYHVPLGKIRLTLDRFSKYLTNGGVFIVRLYLGDKNRKRKRRPMAMIGIIEKEFDVLEMADHENIGAGATVIVFRPK